MSPPSVQPSGPSVRNRVRLPRIPAPPPQPPSTPPPAQATAQDAGSSNSNSESPNMPSIFYEAFKNMIPSSNTEIILYIILVLIVILFIKLVEYTHIQSYVKNTSRCYKNVNLHNYSENTYIIKGFTMSNISILKVTYDFKEKKSSVEITAPKGTVLNKVKIPLYNIRTRDFEEIEKIFYGETDFDLLNESMIYEGNPELVRFMQYLNTDFFDNKMMAV